MKKTAFFLIVTLMGVYLTGCGSAPAASSASSKPPIGETIEMSFTEMERIFGRGWIKTGENYIVQDYPLDGIICFFEFQNGRVIRSDAVVAGDLFESFVGNYTSELGEPFYKDENTAQWERENRPGIIAYVNREAVQGGIVTHFGVGIRAK